MTTLLQTYIPVDKPQVPERRRKPASAAPASTNPQIHPLYLRSFHCNLEIFLIREYFILIGVLLLLF